MPPKSLIWRAASSCCGWVGEAGVEHALDGVVLLEELGDARARSRSASACAARASARRAGRARSRSGPGTAPSDFCRKRRRSAIVGSFVATKPPITSEWPPRYFVVEWTTASAPSSSGRWRYGVANVLSTTRIAPTACAASAAARMSTRFSTGFDGVSTQTMRVRSSRCAARFALNSSAGMYSKW